MASVFIFRKYEFFSSMLSKYKDFSFGTIKFVGCRGDSFFLSRKGKVKEKSLELSYLV